MDRFIVRRADQQDVLELAAMYHSLWPDAAREAYDRELASLLAGESLRQLPVVVLVAQESEGRLIGFLEAGLRSHADGCDPGRPVGFVEGWYVVPEYRRRSVGAQLIAAAEQWAREQGCLEMASDVWLDAVDSQRAHEALGFEIVDRCIHYRKLL
jgi:aminoglycoside 6'-N-acetyltransferase I